MRRLKYGLLAAAMAVSAVAVVAPTTGSEAAAPAGDWIKATNGKQWYKFANGGYAKKEYINGYWVNKAGWWVETEERCTWKNTSKGWKYGNSSWTATNSWYKIDGYWYFFHSDGILATKEYIKGSYVNADGHFIPSYSHGTWHRGSGENSNKWWFFDNNPTTGKKWYAADQWLKVDGYYYHFDAEGWMDSWKLAKLPQIEDESVQKVYAFGGTGRLGNFTQFRFADTISGEITFSFNNATEKNAAAVDMDLFLSLSMDKDATKVLYVDGVQRTISIREIQGEYGPEPVVFIDDETLVEHVNKTTKTSVTVSGSGKLSKLMDAFEASGLGSGKRYDFKVKVGTLQFTKFGMSAGYASFTVNGKNYQALYDGVKEGQPDLFFLGDVSSSLGEAFAEVGMLQPTDFTLDQDYTGDTIVINTMNDNITVKTLSE